MKRFAAILSALLVFVSSFAATKVKTFTVLSPDAQTKVTVHVADHILYDVESRGELLLVNNRVALHLSDRNIGEKPVLSSNKLSKVSSVVRPDFKLKFAEVDNTYNQLTLGFKGGYQVQWRVYDDGFAYRFITNLKGEIDVMEEVSEFNIPGTPDIVGQFPGGFRTPCEELYKRMPLRDFCSNGSLSELPTLIECDNQKMLIAEFDVEDYPGMFLKGNVSTTLSAAHSRSSRKNVDDGLRHADIAEYEDWIAHTSGSRSFPWRYVLITQDDRRLPENRMPMRLAPKSRISDMSWIRRGQTTWDWLNGLPYGEGVNFVSGLNLDTYKYFADFAAANGLDYILIDDGWAKNGNIYETNPELRLPEIIEYAASKGVGVILWVPWVTTYHHMEMFAEFEKWGVKGVKVDFMNRMDQWMVNFYEDVAKEAAKHHIIVDFHGAFQPRGLEYRYPNVLTYEGVRGLEYRHNCTPDNTLFQPYLRNAAGPMDFTPGMMICHQPEFFKGDRPETPAVGTKASQLAQIVAFETGLQMLADNPCRYDKWPDCRDFIVSVPVEWDETIVLEGEVGEYYLVAKRHGDSWYIAALNNSKPRSLSANLSFLNSDSNWEMTSFVDGPMAGQIAMDYRCRKQDVCASDTIAVDMARNGGFAAVIRKK